MMETTGPVDGNVALLAVKASGALHAAAGADAAKFKKAIKDGTVITDVELALLLLVGVHVVGGDLLQEVDVFVGVELGHLSAGSGFGALL